MAKAQSFGDKLKKKKVDTKINLKVIKWYRCPNRGTLRTLERFVKIDDLAECEKIDVFK
ncbi:MAG: hypothetical protein HW421_1853 [Ignavibacteria bacterium]|nr:hypothetical protein [Ignavibacteria bacterium]